MTPKTVEEEIITFIYRLKRTPCCSKKWDGDGNGSWCPKCGKSPYTIYDEYLKELKR